MENASRAAVVTTLRNAGAVLDSFVGYHRAIGFAHLFLYFDDPDDPDLKRMAGMPDVTAVRHDATLRIAWRTLPSYERHRASLDSEVMSRQVLNVEHAMRLARARDCEWLLNIDIDELFLTPGGRIAGHFERLSATAFEASIYQNYEAIPEREEIGDFLREVSLFKLPFQAVQAQLGQQLRQAQQTAPQLRPFFHFYASGKSAVRLTADGLTTAGVHRFERAGAPIKTAQNMRHFILHYACCGFAAFWRKYRTLGQFPDKWWGAYDIAEAIGPFHLECRDAVARGHDEALAFYRERIALSDPVRAGSLIKLGVATRVLSPRQIIDRAGSPRPSP